MYFFLISLAIPTNNILEMLLYLVHLLFVCCFSYNYVCSSVDESKGTVQLIKLQHSWYKQLWMKAQSHQSGTVIPMIKIRLCVCLDVCVCGWVGGYSQVSKGGAVATV